MPRCNERDIIRQRVSLHVHAAAFPLRSLQIISGYARMRGRTRNHYRLADACVHCCNSLPPNPGPPTPLFGLSVLQYTASPTYLTVLITTRAQLLNKPHHRPRPSFIAVTAGINQYIL